MLTRFVLAGLLLPAAIAGCSGPDRDVATSEQSSQLSLPGSHFEIDTNANLVVDTEGNLDWASVDDVKQADTPSGQNDSAYQGGAKEDDPCPNVATGSIPNNKSDLKTFGVYVEPGHSPGEAGFLHLFWTRVQDPNGTTLMDFEFNQSGTACTNGVNMIRTPGDLLLEYRLEQGGATATLKIRTWTDSGWGEATDLSAVGAATGTINSSAIAVADSDGLGALDARTFGEASIDLAYIFQPDRCTSFGSAFVKSRSSDSFTSALKDFISPAHVDITNCGRVVIRKQTDPRGMTESFSYSHTLATDPAQTSSTFTLTDGEAHEFTNVLFGNGYAVTEAAPGAGFTLTDIDCSASSGVTPTTDLATGTVTFDIDSDTDVVDCTYTNQAKGTLIVEKVTADSPGTFGYTSSQLGAFTLSTSGVGAAAKASRTFADLSPGVYGVAESGAPGWHLVSATCSDGSSPAAVGVGAGETVTCTFVNARDRGALKIVKTRLHAADGPGWHPHAGVPFLISGGGLPTALPVVTDASGQVCVDNLLLSSFAGDYTVTELVPTGYVPDGDVAKTASITEAASCPDGVVVAFGNVPLTNLTVTVDSQIPGGTSSTITCTGLAPVTTGADGDGAVSLTDLTPGTYTCTVVVE